MADNRSTNEIIANAEMLVGSGNDIVLLEEGATNTETPEIEQEELLDEALEDETGGDTDEGEEVDSSDSLTALLEKLPDKGAKYRNKDGTVKSAIDVIAMHRNLEKALGMTPEKRKEYLDTLGEALPDDTTAEPVIEADESEYILAPENEEKYEKQIYDTAMIEMKKLNMTLMLDLQEFGGNIPFDIDDSTHRNAWELANETARNIVNITKEETIARLAPLENSKKKSAILSFTTRVLGANKITEISAEAVAKELEDVDINNWRNMPDNMKQGYILQTAKAMAYDAIVNNPIVEKTVRKEPKVLSSGATQSAASVDMKGLTEEQKLGVAKFKRMFRNEIANGIFTDEDAIKNAKEVYPNRKGGK